MKIKEGKIIDLLEGFTDDKEFIDLCTTKKEDRLKTVKQIKEMHKNDNSNGYYLSQSKFNYGKTLKHSIRYQTYGLYNEV